MSLLLEPREFASSRFGLLSSCSSVLSYKYFWYWFGVGVGVGVMHPFYPLSPPTTHDALLTHIQICVWSFDDY